MKASEENQSSNLRKAVTLSLIAVREDDLIEAFLTGRSERTIVAYSADLKDFQTFLGVTTPREAARSLIAYGQGAANAMVIKYKANLFERKLSSATVNRRLAALRSLIRLARTLGIVPWELEVRNVKSKAYRETRGPGLSGVRALISVAKTRRARDLAIIRLLYDLALRRGEVAALDIEDLDLEEGTLSVIAKGKTEPDLLTLPEPTKIVLKSWLSGRGDESGPLFSNFDRAGKGERLTGRSIHRIVVALGLVAGVKIRPHGLRHAAITRCLDKMNGNYRVAQRFSRHADPRTVMVYDDNRKDLGGEAAKMIADEV
ncbi:tyrosine-type recombinase/integrase [Acidobacteriota bacterium]